MDIAGIDTQVWRQLIGDTRELGMVLLLGCRCRCGHVWLPRTEVDDLGATARPSVCPKCKSPRWDKPKKGGI